MLSAAVPQELHPDAPPIVREIRSSFDARFPDLINVVLERTPLESDQNTVHVDFPHGPYQVTAVYNTGLGEFTQLIARAADEAHHERPSFTISLFLRPPATEHR